MHGEEAHGQTHHSCHPERAECLQRFVWGCVGRREPAGSLETKKCVDKLFTLRAKYQGKGKAAQLRAASGRMITDMEMNSTYRGAVEIFNLCRNLHSHDVLFAECIRTFKEHTVDGRSWMYRLEAWQLNKNLADESLQSYVPPHQNSEYTNGSIARQRI